MSVGTRLVTDKYPMPKAQSESWIPGWGQVRHRTARAFEWCVVVVNLVFAAFLLVGGVSGAVSGDFRGLEVVVILLIGIFFAAIAVFYFGAALWRPRPAASDLSSTAEGPPGIVIPIRRSLDAALIVTGAAAGGAAAVGAVATTGGWRVLWAVVALSTALVVGPFLWTWPMARRMVISTDGLLVEDGVQSAYLAWDDIDEIIWGTGHEMDFVYRLVGRPAAPSWRCERRSIRFRPERATILVRTVRIDLDPLLLGWALMTYRFYPKLREELVTGVARSRLLDPGYASAATPSRVSTLEPFSLYRPRWLVTR